MINQKQPLTGPEIIEAAVAEERNRCVRCIRQRALEGGSQWAWPLRPLAIELIEAIECGDEP